MITTIMFDFWGTLVENGIWSPTKQIRNILEIKIPFPEYIVRMEKAMMTKHHKDLNESFTYVCNEFNIDPTPDKIEKLIGMWNKAWMLAYPYDDVIRNLSKLNEKYDLVLVSNSDCFSLNNVLEKYDLKKHFKNIYLSCEVGLIKSNPEMFYKILNDLNLKPEECVMIGDSIQSDMVSSKSCGLTSVLIDRKNMRDYHPKIKTLDELEKVLNI